MWKPWYLRLKDWFYRAFIECPVCKGRGGEKEVICDDGTGPYYPCEYCKEKGWVHLGKKILWWWWEMLEAVRYKKYKKDHTIKWSKVEK